MSFTAILEDVLGELTAEGWTVDIQDDENIEEFDILPPLNHQAVLVGGFPLQDGHVRPQLLKTKPV